MRDIYKCALDKVEMNEDKRQELRNKLMEVQSGYVYIDNKKPGRPKWLQICAAVAVLIAVLLCIPTTRTLASAALEYVLGTFRFSDGTTVTLEQNEEGNESIFTVSVDEDRRGYIEVVDDRIYFIHKEIKEDITEQCSETEYFEYEETDENGNRHLIFVGGTPEHAGWVELLFDSEGRYITNMMNVPEDSSWVELAMDAAGVPTGNPELDKEFLN